MACEKCGYRDKKEIEKFNKKLCKICSKFSPNNQEEFEKYINEKIDWKILETFRKFQTNKNLIGMQKKANQGKIMNRAPFGYRLIEKKLIPEEEEKLKVQRIFLDFLEQDISLNQLSKVHGFSVNGLKKILKNFTYLGKTKFAGQISQGTHQPIITHDIFNKVQNKLDEISRS